MKLKKEKNPNSQLKRAVYLLWQRARVKIERGRRKELAMELTVKIIRSGPLANGFNPGKMSLKKLLE